MNTTKPRLADMLRRDRDLLDIVNEIDADRAAINRRAFRVIRGGRIEPPPEATFGALRDAGIFGLSGTERIRKTFPARKDRDRRHLTVVRNG